ncbi:MAG: class I tRNA ligase family protein, partial [Clostridia bacterium]|nr:class I tRNA ligase family protein [Clostridia bacterium]
KMSKSKGNVVNPDQFVEQYGADAMRLYLLFGFNFVDGGPWSDDGIKACAKFLARVERLVENVFAMEQGFNASQYSDAEKALDYARNFCLKEYEANVESYGFNSAVARVMEFTNALYKYILEKDINVNFVQDHVKDLLMLLAPFAPYTCEELWQIIGGEKSIFRSGFPTLDETKLVQNEIEFVVQINSKIVGRFNADPKSDKAQLEVLAKNSMQEKLVGKEIIKTVVIPGKLVNFVCR